jgi:hypothetical protein
MAANAQHFGRGLAFPLASLHARVREGSGPIGGGRDGASCQMDLTLASQPSVGSGGFWSLVGIALHTGVWLFWP